MAALHAHQHSDNYYLSHLPPLATWGKRTAFANRVNLAINSVVAEIVDCYIAGNYDKHAKDGYSALFFAERDAFEGALEHGGINRMVTNKYSHLVYLAVREALHKRLIDRGALPCFELTNMVESRLLRITSSQDGASFRIITRGNPRAPDSSWLVVADAGYVKNLTHLCHELQKEDLEQYLECHCWSNDKCLLSDLSPVGCDGDEWGLYIGAGGLRDGGPADPDDPNSPPAHSSGIWLDKTDARILAYYLEQAAA